MAWRLAKSLIKLRTQINDRWPNRSKISDGSIGDEAHSARASDHNPDSRGIVCAIDITKDDANGPDLHLLAEALTNDQRTKYLIYTARIWKARTQKWEPYRGPNKHNHHLHVSVQAQTADDERTWQLTTDITPLSYPVLEFGARGQAVRELQERLRAANFSLAVDGAYGRATEAAVRNFQLREGLASTGIADGATWVKLKESK